MSFTAVPPAPQSPAGSVVSAGSWWPEISLNELRDVLRLGDVVPHSRLLNAARGAVAMVLDELAAWKAAREAEGATDLLAVPCDIQIDGETKFTVQFVRAVQFAAGAEIADLYRAVTATNEANTRADAQALTADDYRRMSTHAIRDILGETRTTVELI